ncbi:hypothetical protein JCGZ_20145 [Jatropha curcas]|uniref:WRKY transcription factor 13 n=1 Tax=Jatropha curcas TaxID=180498 RepID=S5CFR3_JATCU|nr:probable WRKY transcription factor 45 [Jatropha curcas]AGQ04201.1 WRKY transcription factor 13 [Jatropha curcas]KDP27505.1 hypothetical protein JCGZ_20145 [Jatropha curcas]
MSDSQYSSFLETDIPQNPNFNAHSSNSNAMNTSAINYQNLELLDLMLAEELEKDFTEFLSQNPDSHQNQLRYEDEVKKRMKIEKRNKIAFRTKSMLEVMDDGFKWRKYGKKAIKNNTNPRNYYRCSNEGCRVKKRVERDGKDSSYVITTYEGVHNHESPFTFDKNNNKTTLD